ncbi:Frequency clock protein [Neonectria ditissima]|uniref:Frequency clock protein n=1 Tax=Neonectria ditissima TaxID=78410 RepID=A0A0N8H8D9_9HYPO|nr:Frequency clock protein [Neonectria ditissima]
MNSTEGQSHKNQPPTGPNGHPLPRRAEPSKSVTLRHHALARDASNRNMPGSALRQETTIPSISRRVSSNESHETGQSDPKNWFDQSNENPAANFGNGAMDVDPPFFQRDSEMSNEDKSFAYNHQLTTTKLTTAPQSSSADDFRSVIDDLTVEIQNLKEELKRYKQTGPDMLRKEKLFEIKVHGLPNKKKRELEATLRDFAAGLGSSPDASSSQRNKKSSSSRHANRDRMYSASGSMSKHASSSSGSNFPPADSAYASMSVGAKSSGPSLARPMKGSKDANQKKVQNYLNDIPEGLYPRHMIMTERERKKLVVRRLEQLFTGKIGGRHVQQKQIVLQEGKPGEASIAVDTQPRVLTTLHEPPSLMTLPELAREAKIHPSEQQTLGKSSRPRDEGSAFASHGDQTEPSSNNHSTGSVGPNPSSPSRPLAPEQRPTRPRDLDPDRTQIPSENMDYIRHLGLAPPKLLPEQSMVPEDVHPDADGWVYLNLLCSLAQLHIINVTPDFVRLAVSEFSSQFQLSSDGRKIRWRGGSQGTKFSSDSSGYNSQQSPSHTDTDDSNTKSRKRQKTGRSVGDEQPDGSTKKVSKFGAPILTSSESFHYKPILVHRDSSNGRTSMDETISSSGQHEESNGDESRWGYSGSTSNQKKRRHDGAIIYYSGALFCTDLSGDPGDVSTSSNILSATQTTQDEQQQPHFDRSSRRRTSFGSSINYGPLGDGSPLQGSSYEMDVDGAERAPSPTTAETGVVNDVDLDLVWSDNDQHIDLQPLEPCGLGGVLPDDHFIVVVTTKRPKEEASPPNPSHQMSNENTDAIIRRMVSTSASPDLRPSELFPEHKTQPQLKIEYVSGGIKRLPPVSLPPPAMFLPPFSADDSTTEDMDDDDDDDTDSSNELIGRRMNLHRSNDYPDGIDLSSGDEDGEDPDDSPGEHNMYAVTADTRAQALPTRSRSGLRRGSSSVAAAVGTAREGSKSTATERTVPTGNASDGIADETSSGYSSSSEESS